MKLQMIWKSMPGSAPLHEIYGYWPSLHDARVRSIKIGYAERTLEMVMDYPDLGPEGIPGGDINTRFTLIWRGVVAAWLRQYESCLYGVEFSRQGDLIETKFDPYTWGLEGYILAATIEVANIEPAPDMSKLHQDDPARHETFLDVS